MNEELTAEKALETLDEILLEMPAYEYERLMDITSEGSENFVCLGHLTIIKWLERAKIK